jgi:hypothetical protein
MAITWKPLFCSRDPKKIVLGLDGKDFLKVAPNGDF